MVQLASPAPYASVDPGLEFGNTTVKPYSRTRPHGGKDHQWSLANPVKSKQTHAPAAGIVKAAFNDGKWHNGWGNYVDIHITTEAFVRLAHHETGTVRVRAGQIVALMDRIGTMGDTGEVKKNHDHLHEELWLKQKDGSWKRVDPDLYRGPKGRHLPGKALVAAPKPAGSVKQPKPPRSTYYGKQVTTTAVNMRSEPNTKSRIVTVVPAGKVVLNGAAVNGWHPVKYGTKIGWIRGDFIVVRDKTVKAEKGLNLRKTPTTAQRNIIAGLKKGTKVTVLAVQGTKDSARWWKVRVGTRTGWVDSRFLG